MANKKSQFTNGELCPSMAIKTLKKTIKIMIGAVVKKNNIPVKKLTDFLGLEM